MNFILFEELSPMASVCVRVVFRRIGSQFSVIKFPNLENLD